MSRTIRQIKPLLPEAPRQLNVAAYARVSSGKDAMLHSLSAQVSYYSALIQKNPQWKYAGVYVDKAFTGTSDTRPEFQRMLADCRAGEIDLIMTKSVTRFARNTLTLLRVVRELKEFGVDVFFEEQNMHSMSGDGELMLSILASYAQEESRSVSENCKWRLRKKMERGEIVGLRAMYGYQISRGSIRIDPEQAAVVRRIFSDYLAGQSSMRIAKALNVEQIPTCTGVPWTDKRVREILTNEKYAGNALMQKKYVVDYLTKREKINHGELPQYFAEGTHVAIIEQPAFDRAQQILSERREHNKASKPSTARYPFSGLITCGTCGGKFRHRTCNGKLYWQCETFLYQGKSVCPAKQIPEGTLYEITATALGSFVFDEAELKQRVKRIVVIGPNSLRYEFFDGSFSEIAWKDRSRSESWTPEMRQKAAAQMRRRYVK